MEFVETHESKKFGNWTIVLQEYLDEDDNCIYNVSIEYDDGFLTPAIDVFETNIYNNAEDYYKNLVNDIIITNKLEEPTI